MAKDDLKAFLEKVVGWDGFEVAGVTTEDIPGPDVLGFPASRIVIELRRKAGATPRCSGCGEIVTEIHDERVRRVRDLPLGQWDTWLLVPRSRLECPRCGPTVEDIDWLDRYQRMTKRLERKIALLAEIATIKSVAEWFGVSWSTVRAIHKRALEERLGTPDLSGVRRIAIDEFALHKGQRYATVVLDAETRSVIWVGRGRKKEDLRVFFEMLGPEGCSRIEAAVMDMSDAYELETRANCPNVTIVYDLFHMMSQFTISVVDRVRLDETNRISRADPNRLPAVARARGVIKGTKWLLLHNRENLSRSERIKLKELLSLNRKIYVAYLLKDAFRDLWRYRYPGAAMRAWEDWYGWAVRSRIAPLVKYAKKLKRRLPGIIAHCRYPLNTSVLEGINNKIKVMKRTAYGYRDDDYFFLKIRAAFPQIPR